MEEKEEKQKQKKVAKKREITVKANKKGRHIMHFMNFLRILVLPIYWLLKPCRFYGNRKVKDGAAVYVSNHRVMFDIAYPAMTTWEGLHFVPKKSLTTKPIVRGLIRILKAIPVNRDGNDVRALLDCFKCLKNGEKVVVFPEGKRNKTDEIMLPFKGGAAVMAIRTKSPIIPIVVYSKPRFFRCTHILIDDPFELSEYYDRKLTEEEIAEADDKLREHMLQMHRAHTEYLQAKKRKKKEKKA
ncbi:MAG: 1-acyl-sn-glycerol-3-phosphate acyltransferase [Clostridiales bacterium]|nr:1-acyl-sn-glycerol-3-phosphate acyltransferase [Clostridiales bacterium]